MSKTPTSNPGRRTLEELEPRADVKGGGPAHILKGEECLVFSLGGIPSAPSGVLHGGSEEKKSS